MKSLINLLNKEEKFVVGLMSGTSMDGIDTALVKLSGNGLSTKLELVQFNTYCYPEELESQLLACSQPGKGSVDQICSLDVLVGEYFADAVIRICEEAKISCSQVDLVGSHGQTIHHLPDVKIFKNKKIRSTFQIGDPAVIANRTGVITVSEFRNADMALGGQGAPLIPYFDYIYFRSSDLNRIILNIGGISNFTILQKNAALNDVLAYDTGPGNMVINALMKKFFNRNFDNNGDVARQGTVSERLLESLMQHPYLNRQIPKSTGRKDFGNFFAEDIVNKASKLNLESEDIIATATEFTAASIAFGMKYSPFTLEGTEQLIISGGGMHNSTIVESLKKKFKWSGVFTTDEFGIPSDAKEAICFAVLANETIAGHHTNLPSVTGASRGAILGNITIA